MAQYFTVGRGGGCLRAWLKCFEEHGKDLILVLRSGRKVVLRAPQGVAGEQDMCKVAVYNKAL